MDNTQIVMTQNQIQAEADKRYPSLHNHITTEEEAQDSLNKGFVEGAEWAKNELITRTCHALDKVLSQQMLAELVKVMEGV